MLKKTKYMVGVAFASFALLFSVAAPKIVGAQSINEPPIDEKIYICHRTNSVKNPYIKIEVAVSSADGIAGNSTGNQPDHYDEHQGQLVTSEEEAQALKDKKIKWGDIIPPIEGVHDGRNWQNGEKIWNNNCGYGEDVPVEVIPAAVTFTNPTCATQGTYTVPTTQNVKYLINGNVVAADTYTAENGTTVEVIGEAEEGFYVADDTTDTWTNTFTAPTNCGQVLGEQTVAPQVTAAPTGGVNAGAGGASNDTAAIIGLVGSVLTIGLGLVVRKFTN